ncbi:MAG: DUF86 domain-containing protein [Proteobacteria bacterium]|nr:DUF86 domain-containing protein [Pseudomonadota bacterium]
MYDRELLADKLSQVSDALDRISRRFAEINSADDFLTNDHGLDMLDSICMMLITVGENFKAIDKMTGGTFLEHYPNINWRGVKGVRDVIFNQYFNIDGEEIYYICSHDLEPLRSTVKKMIQAIQQKSGG